ncbi:hypothetical protein QQF64_034839 [Cirrhinus molitorella]|uniref:Uncharacterized protein n=1 Tax=Cirrhinus molitorella TaxID=172907 RepID=A0ABR3L1Q3_9TELE
MGFGNLPGTSSSPQMSRRPPPWSCGLLTQEKGTSRRKGKEKPALSSKGEALAARSMTVGVAPAGQLPPCERVRMAERSKALRSGRSLPWRRNLPGTSQLLKKNVTSSALQRAVVFDSGERDKQAEGTVKPALSSKALSAPTGQLPPRNVSGWPSGLRRCVQVAVSPGGVGSNPTSDRTLLWLRTTAAVFSTWQNMWSYIRTMSLDGIQGIYLEPHSFSPNVTPSILRWSCGLLTQEKGTSRRKGKEKPALSSKAGGLPGLKGEALAARSMTVGVAPAGQLPPCERVRMAERSKALRSSWGTIVQQRWGRRGEKGEERKEEGEEEREKMKKRESEMCSPSQGFESR